MTNDVLKSRNQGTRHKDVSHNIAHHFQRKHVSLDTLRMYPRMCTELAETAQSITCIFLVCTVDGAYLHCSVGKG